MLRISKKIYSILTLRQKKFLILLIVMMLIGGVMESFSVSLMLPLVSAIMDTHSWNSTWYAKIVCDLFNISNHRSYIIVLIVLLFFVFLFKNIYLLVEYYFQYTYSYRCNYHMQYRIIKKYMYMPYSFFLSASTGELVRVINSDTAQAYSVLESLMTVLTELISCVALGVTIFIMSPWMAIGITFILLFEILIIMKIIKPRMVRYGDVSREKSAVAYQWMLQGFDGIKSIKVSKKEDYFLHKYDFYYGFAVEIFKRYNIFKTLPRLLIESFTICSVLAIMAILIAFGTEMQSLVPVMSAFVLAAMRLLPSTNRISIAVSQLPFLEGGLDNIINIVNQEDISEAIQNKKGLMEESHSEISFKNSINLEHISFAYPGKDVKVLDDVMMEIRAKQSVGIIGTSGGGKTTTVDIMLGLLNPQEGRITVDGKDISYNMEKWLDKVAYIPQQIFLIDGSIRSNIAFGQDENISDEKVLKVAEEAQLSDFVNSLPDGLDTQVGEQGVRLSGGQRQRIGIARALYSNAEVLFFDEATSALDNETEKAVMDAINGLKSKKTMVIIAHRLSTIENCDVVYRIENGKIIKER